MIESINNKWLNNNLLDEARKVNQHYDDPSQEYHYWDKPMSYEDLMAVKDDEETMFNIVIKHYLNIDHHANVNTYDDYLKYKRTEPILTDSILDCIDQVLDMGRKNNITLYRALYLYPGKRFNPNELGICWAWDTKGMIEYMDSIFCDLKYDYDNFNPNHRIITLKASTTRDNIDWVESIFLHMYYRYEHELRVYDPRKLNLLKKDIYKVRDVNNLADWQNTITGRIYG